MNLEDLQQNWREQKAEENLVVALFKESRQQKIKSVFRKTVLGTLLFALLNLLINIYAWLVLIPYFSNLSIRFAALCVLILTYTVFYKNIFQLVTLSKIGYDRPVISSQKTIEKLKVRRIRHNRFIFIFSNLFFWSLLIIVFKIDLQLLIPQLWEKAKIVPMIHIGFALLWFPVALWILKQYDKEKPSKFWKKLRDESLLTDQSLNLSLNRSLKYIEELKYFEKEELR